MNKDKIGHYSVLIGLGAYFLSCIFIMFVYLSGYLGLSFIKKELSFGEILNSITAIGIAFIIPFIIEKRFTRNKTLSESMYTRLKNLQDELESFMVDIENKCIDIDIDITKTEHNKLIINLKLRKIGLNINGFRREFPQTYQELLVAYAKFRKITTLLVEPGFVFDSNFYKNSYLRYIDFDKHIEDVKLGTIDLI